MGFFDAVGFGLMMLGVLAGFLGLSFWGVITKRPVILFFGLMMAGIISLIYMFSGQIDAGSMWGVVPAVMIFGAIGAGIFGSIQATAVKARFLMGSALIAMSGACFLTFFGMIDIVPSEAVVSQQILKVLAWNIVGPLGIMGLAEFFVDFFGVGVTASPAMAR